MRPNWEDGRERRYEGGAWLPFNWAAIPVTRALLFGTVGAFLLVFFTGGLAGPVGRRLVFQSGDWWLQPWSVLTYAFLEQPDIWLVVTLYVLYRYGGSLERAWGSVNFLVLFLGFTAIGALAFVPAALLLGEAVILVGLGVVLTALVTAWAAMDPELEVSVFGLVVKAKFIAAVWVALSYFRFGSLYGPVMALFILAAPAAAFFYVRKLPRLNLSGPRPGSTRREFDPDRWAPDLREDPLPRRRGERPEQIRSGFDPLRKRREQQEIERLRRLLGEDDDDRPGRRR